MFVRVCMYVCVCVCETERERVNIIRPKIEIIPAQTFFCGVFWLVYPEFRRGLNISVIYRCTHRIIRVFSVCPCFMELHTMYLSVFCLSVLYGTTYYVSDCFMFVRAVWHCILCIRVFSVCPCCMARHTMYQIVFCLSVLYGIAYYVSEYFLFVRAVWHCIRSVRVFSVCPCCMALHTMYPSVLYVLVVCALQITGLHFIRVVFFWFCFSGLGIGWG